MKILKKNLKRGEVKVLVDAPEDIWYLSQIIDPGDVLKGKTLRKIKPTPEAKAERRQVFLVLKVEKTEFEDTVLRATGKILEGPEDVPRGSYHSFVIEQKTRISIIKQKWFSYQLDRLEEAAQTKLPAVLVCVFDREEVFFALMKRTGYKILSHIHGDVPKKMMKQKLKGKAGFYEQIIKELEAYDERFKLDYIVLASPAFWKEELFKVLRNEALKKKIIQATCSSVDEGAINEVLKRDEVRKALQKERVLREIELVEQVMIEVSKQNLAVYGLSATEDAVVAGAVSTLLVTDSLIGKMREEGTFARLDSLMRSVEQQKGKVVLISSTHQGGKRLDGLGGIAALLRYKLSY